MYKQHKLDGNVVSDIVIRVSDGAYIPINVDNTDYQAYLKWLDGYELQGIEWFKTSDGNTPLPADEPNEGTE
jgi:hypothetical protein